MKTRCLNWALDICLAGNFLVDFNNFLWSAKADIRSILATNRRRHEFCNQYSASWSDVSIRGEGITADNGNQVHTQHIYRTATRKTNMVMSLVSQICNTLMLSASMLRPVSLGFEMYPDWGWNIFGNLGQYFGCWCPDLLSPRLVRSHWRRKNGTCIPFLMISITTSKFRNERKWKYILTFSLNKSSR